MSIGPYPGFHSKLAHRFDEWLRLLGKLFNDYVLNVSSGVLLGRFSSGTGPLEEITIGTNLTLTSGGVLNASGGGGSGNSVTVTCDFGASFTDKAQTIVTGKTWVTSGSEIIAQVLTPSGVDPDEIRLLGFNPVISDLVVGDGFTVTLFSEPEAKGTYDVMCIGV